MAKGQLDDLTGTQRGSIHVLCRAENTPHGDVCYYCRCDCGHEFIAYAGNLRRRKYQRCAKCRPCTKEANYASEVWHQKALSKLPGEQGLSKLFSIYKRNARTYNRTFNLTKEQFTEMTSKNCFYCGRPPYSIMHPDRTCRPDVREKGKYVYSGIDRVDSDFGYSLNNCLPCCKICNWLKRDMTQEEFFNHLLAVTKHLLQAGLVTEGGGMVVKKKEGFYVVSHEGKNLGGPYKAEEEAKKRLAAEFTGIKFDVLKKEIKDESDLGV